MQCGGSVFWSCPNRRQPESAAARQRIRRRAVVHHLVPLVSHQTLRYFTKSTVLAGAVIYACERLLLVAGNAQDGAGQRLGAVAVSHREVVATVGVGQLAGDIKDDQCTR